MLSAKHQVQLISVGVVSLLTWAATTFGLIIFVHLKETAVLDEQSRGFIYRVVPGLTAGYLLIGLLILRYVHKARNDGDTAA